MFRRALAASFIAAVLSGGGLAEAQSASGTGRVTFFSTFQRARFDSGTTRDFSEFSTSVTLRSRLPEGVSGVEYAFNVRGSAYPSSDGRDNRTRIYDAWAGGRTAGGRLSLRAGQMWLHELGALGSVGGLMAEYRVVDGSAGRVRLGLFGGAEPKSFDAGFVPDVRKGGAWVSLDGRGMRRHVLAYVTTRNSGLTERSVLSATNFVPVGSKFYLYQLAEYDLAGPGGTGAGGLNYFFANARWTATSRVEVMANVHRGRSIDARTIAQDILDGRPVDRKSLDGFLFESAGGRVTVEVLRNVRVHAGYATDRHNRDEQAYGRISAGVWAGNVAGSGIDLTLSDHRTDGRDGSYDAWYVSAGRSFGTRLYASADYATSLSVVHVASGNTTVERRPRSSRYGLHGLCNITRSWSLLLDAERLIDESATDDRGTLGLVIRF